MKLSLVPMDGENVVNDKERERMKRRAHRIPPETLGRFNNVDRKQIKDFLISLITLTQRVHLEMMEYTRGGGDLESYDGKSSKLQAQREILFDNLPPAVKAFAELLHFHPMEPWPEFEKMIASIRAEDCQSDPDAKSEAADDASEMDPGEDESTAEAERLRFAMRCRITPHEIKEMVQFNSLERLVRHVGEGRRLASGAFWDVNNYNV